MNSIADPEHIVPAEASIRIGKKGFQTTLDPYSLTVVRIKLK
jgi:alpha-L-arabinofuranosidase